MKSLNLYVELLNMCDEDILKILTSFQFIDMWKKISCEIIKNENDERVIKDAREMNKLSKKALHDTILYALNFFDNDITISNNDNICEEVKKRDDVANFDELYMQAYNKALEMLKLYRDKLLSGKPLNVNDFF